MIVKKLLTTDAFVAMVDMLVLGVLAGLAWYVAGADGSANIRAVYLRYARVHSFSALVVTMYILAVFASKLLESSTIYLVRRRGFLQATIDVLLSIALGMWLLGSVYGTTSSINEQNISFYRKLSNIIYIIMYILIFKNFVFSFVLFSHGKFLPDRCREEVPSLDHLGKGDQRSQIKDAPDHAQ